MKVGKKHGLVRTAKKLTSWLLSLALVLSVFATIAPVQKANADTPFDYRTLIPNGNETSAELTAKQVKFNGNSWYLTNYDAAAGTVTLFSAGQIGQNIFDQSSSDYAGSGIQVYLNNLTKEGGSYYDVAPAIAAVDLPDVNVNDAKLYLLSETELNNNPENVKFFSENYWLRTKGPDGWLGAKRAKNCYPAFGKAKVGEAAVTDSKAVRPALKLRLSRVNYDQSTKTFTVKQPTGQYTVTFKVSGGSWNDETTEDKTVTLDKYEGEDMKLEAGDIPAVGGKPAEGHKAGSWDVTPDTETVITGNMTYKYTYDEKQPISAKVKFNVVNGSWNDKTNTTKEVTLNGYEEDTLKLAADQIPAVGGEPSEGYKKGSWGDTAPSTDTSFEPGSETTYTYTYAEREPADDIKDLIPTNDQSWDDIQKLQVSFNGFKWYVIDFDDDNNTCTLFAAKPLAGSTRFDGFSNRYGRPSELKVLLDGMTAKGGKFEGAAYSIKQTNLTDIDPIAENVYIFPLSVAEAKKVPEEVRRFDSDYWLRSQSITYGDGGAAQVATDGTIGEAWGGTSSVQIPKGVRPALILDLKKTPFVKDTKTFMTKQTVTPPTAAQDLAYTGEGQELLSKPVAVISGNKTDGAVQYSTDGTNWSADIPKATEPGTYDVMYKVAGNGEFDDFTCSATVSVSMDKAERQAPTNVFATYGQTLNDVSLPEGWSWADSTTSVGDATLASSPRPFPANYTETKDTAHYKDLTNKEIYVNVQKADQTAPTTPTASDRTPVSITLTAIENGEYSMDGEKWQESPEFTGLVADTEYSFYQRLKEDSNHNASPASAKAAISTLPKYDQQAPAAPTAKEITADSVTLDAIDKGEYKCDEGDWQESPEFTGLQSNKEYTFYQRLKENASHNASPNSKGLKVKVKDADVYAVEKMINDLPESDKVTTADKGSIGEARAAYDKLTADQKNVIDDVIVKKLEDAEKALASAEKAAADKAAAGKVSDMINALPAAPGIDDAAKVEAARKAYDALTADQKKLVSQDAVKRLQNAESAVAAAKKAEETAKSVKNITLNASALSASAIDSAVKKAGGSEKYVTSFTLGKKVKKIKSKAFAKYKSVNTLTVKTKKLKNKSVKGSLKGSNIKKIKVKVGNKKVNKKFVKKYKKIFTKKNAGKKVKVS